MTKHRPAHRPKAILFDLDDTLISTHMSPRQVWRDTIEPILTAETSEALDDIAEAIVRSAKQFWSDPERHKVGRMDLIAARKTIVADALHGWAFFSDDVISALAHGHATMQHDRTALYPDAIETLTALRDEGVALALVTNGAAPIQRRKVERFALAPRFDHIQIEGEAGVGKPEPAAYRKALSALRAEPEETWMVGDNLEWEVAAPQRLGIHGIWRDPAGIGELPDTHIKPDRVISRLLELVEA
ncbi:MAG: HAD family hydrolase [Rhodospirillaceae bacterium]|jgi:putative hydrolase of the HAD superfamily|nr:HAD family hydrolase [Rhodospirillaceae bacterium]